jgi:hypothetical protein
MDALDAAITSPSCNKKDFEIENPFLIIEKNKEENLEFVLEILQEITAKRNTCKYVKSVHSIQSNPIVCREFFPFNF